tara:strand:- start:507 stop:923 length:417 start_codon:yes stop_codon:yes gene_type:complete
MKALEQFFHFCIVCWTLAGIGAINTALHFPPDQYREIVYFTFFIVLGIIGNQFSLVIYHGRKSYLSILFSICLYLTIILSLFYTKQIFFGLFISILAIAVTNKLLSKNGLKWKSIFSLRFYYRSCFEIKRSFKKTIAL